MFQAVNEAFNTLSVSELRAEYDGLFRMRCVLEQGSLTDARLREQPLDLIYMFAVTHRKGLGMREESVLIVNLQDGLAAGRIERWRGGDAIDQRPLSALRSAELEGAASRDIKLQLQDEAGKPLPSLALSARSAADAASICALLHALRGALLTRDEARLRRDDRALPPPPVQQGWLTIKLAGQGHALSRPFRAFALLGRSKLLLFSDRTCRGVLKAPSWWCHSSLSLWRMGQTL
jgi:curved DNA-binding protein CbpA